MAMTVGSPLGPNHTSFFDSNDYFFRLLVKYLKLEIKTLKEK